MIVLAPVNSPSVGRERRGSAVVNVMPACLQCGSPQVRVVDATLAIGHDVDRRAFSYWHRRTIEVELCPVCGFVSSCVEVTS